MLKAIVIVLLFMIFFNYLLFTSISTLLNVKNITNVELLSHSNGYHFYKVKYKNGKVVDEQVPDNSERYKTLSRIRMEIIQGQRNVQ